MLTHLEPNWLDCMIAHIYYQTGNFIKNIEQESKNKVQSACRKILLVEDDPMVQKVHVKYLANSKFSVDVANNYMEALVLYDAEKYDLILTDVGLPDKSGIELCRKIRKLERATCNNIPIVVITASEHFDSIKKESYNAGATYFTVKPLLQNELMQIVEKLTQDMVL